MELEAFRLIREACHAQCHGEIFCWAYHNVKSINEKELVERIGDYKHCGELTLLNQCKPFAWDA